MEIDEEKLRNSFKLIKEDISDLYNNIAEIQDSIKEMQLDLRILADKIATKANKK